LQTAVQAWVARFQSQEPRPPERAGAGFGGGGGKVRAGLIPVRLTYLIGMPKECAA
jgi:hypothetical protein